MLVESKNSSPEWLSNFIAAHDDAIKRCRIQEGMKYATGISGGARYAGSQVGVRPGFAGVILQAAGFNYGDTGGYIYGAVEKNSNISICMIVGDKDYNLPEVSTMKRQLPKRNPFKHISFSGGHTGAPAEKIEEAMEWMSEQLIFTTKNKDICRRVFASNLKSLESIENKYLKYRKLDLLVKIATKHRLNNEPEVKKHLGDIKVELATLKKDKTVAKEVAAEKAFDFFRFAVV